jgi:hypothetical protein
MQCALLPRAADWLADGGLLWKSRLRDFLQIILWPWRAVVGGIFADV